MIVYIASFKFFHLSLSLTFYSFDSSKWHKVINKQQYNNKLIAQSFRTFPTFHCSHFFFLLIPIPLVAIWKSANRPKCTFEIRNFEIGKCDLKRFHWIWCNRWCCRNFSTLINTGILVLFAIVCVFLVPFKMNLR